MRKKPIIFAMMFLLAACASPEPETVTVRETIIAEVPVTVEVTREVKVTQIVEVTRKVEVTRELPVTRVIERPVTITSTSTPRNTPTPSNTPTITPTPSNTPTTTPSLTPTATPDLAQTATIEAYGALAAPKRDGFYTVGEEILSGKWRSTGTSDGCYWARLDSNQETLDNHFGDAGGTVNVRPTDFEVEFDGCGTWEYVENEIPVLQVNATSPKGDGFYTVGIEIAPGRWDSTGTGDGCYWARLDANQNTIDNHFGSAGGSLNIRATDYEVEFSGCGTWEYMGP